MLTSLPLIAAEDATDKEHTSPSLTLGDETPSKDASAGNTVHEDMNNTEKMPPENSGAEGDKEKDTLEGENEKKSPSTILKNNPPFEWPPFENSLPPFERTNPFEDTPPPKN